MDKFISLLALILYKNNIQQNLDPELLEGDVGVNPL